MRIGYGRVSTRDQNLHAQADALRAAGCEEIYVDKASGKLARRPELDRALHRARAGDKLVITKLDRLGRSLEHLLQLTLATNAIVCWSTEYHGIGVAALRHDGRQVDDEVLARIWPTHHENVHFYGTHSVDIDGELAQLDADGYRPLRPLAGAALD